MTPVADPPEPAAGAPDLADLAARFLDAQLAGDQWAAYRVATDALAAGYSVRDVQFRIVRAAQERIGILWQGNRLSISQEHLATGISQVVLARLLEHVRQPSANGKLVVVACVEGELHDLPARLVADCLSQEGFWVRFLGANVPTDSLLQMLAEQRPDLLALSITMTFHIPALRGAVGRIRAALPDLPIAVGGHAIGWSPRLPDEIGAATAPTDPEGLVAVARRLTGVHQ